MPVDVAHALLRRKLTRAVKHRRGHVDPGYSPRIRPEGANYETWPTGDIENCVPRTGLSRVHNHLQRALSLIIAAALKGSAWRENWSRVMFRRVATPRFASPSMAITA